MRRHKERTLSGGKPMSDLKELLKQHAEITSKIYDLKVDERRLREAIGEAIQQYPNGTRVRDSKNRTYEIVGIESVNVYNDRASCWHTGRLVKKDGTLAVNTTCLYYMDRYEVVS
jgi:hypothetical protein